VAFADAMVGRTMAALNKSRFKDNTMVILFSDHGYNIGEKDYLFKYCLWEESTKVPLIIKHPTYKKNAGKRVHHPVSLVDIYPTLNDLCGLQGPTIINEKGAAIDGHSLKPFLDNPSTKDWSGPSVALTIIASWKSQNPKRQHFSVRSENFRYILYENGSEELYDHRTDDNEWTNLASNSKYKKVKQQLRASLNQFFDK
jgi:arylsulfatase A-like enzyme